MDGWMDGLMDGWMDGFRIYVFFDTISVVSGQWKGDKERLSAMGPPLMVEHISASARNQPIP